MKRLPLILTESHPSDRAPQPQELIRQTVTIWLKKQLRK